ncbi:helix-turn-helix transcriptional regulator [Microbacterium testaceum]|uniref:helix-turn-helix transcriptional regulator n=1 Tax=Microbacterium testaceum TaxID=2033 RepID=UPI002434EC5F|nr:helix-turn-helix transcriptional regulator [Microbacterium testaceum]
MKTSNTIRTVRRERGLTQEALAALCFVSRQTIVSLEAGQHDPSLVLALRISDALGASVHDVFKLND